LVESIIFVGALVTILVVATSYAAVEYYRQLRRAQKEYEKARDMVEDIVLSFNRELRREAERIERVASTVENASAKADAGLRMAESFDRKLEPIENQIHLISNQVDLVNASSQNNAKFIENLSTLDLTAIGTIDIKVKNIEASQESLKSKITALEVRLEEQVQKLSTIPELKNEFGLASTPVMPIKRDKAMAYLTETEVAVLEYLSAEGPKTAPEIKEKVRLSREHTARLMKKLYEEGYLERETGKLPFKYSVKKEMEKLLRKPDPPMTT
jgi:DNA-binding MarR family transcriptional regulator